MRWDPELYESFKAQRALPFEDLWAWIQSDPIKSAVDLGCGPGPLTAKLAERLPRAQVLGVDTSPEMLEKARALSASNLHFESGDLSSWKGDYDLVFSHAAVQWVPYHDALFEHLWTLVKPGGQLAVQMPANHNHPTHTLMMDLAQESPYKEALGGWFRVSPVLKVEQYARILYQLGGKRIKASAHIYGHVMPGVGAMVDWVKGSVLRPYLARLEPELAAQFEAEYTRRLAFLFPETPVFYDFKRILLYAQKEKNEHE